MFTCSWSRPYTLSVAEVLTSPVYTLHKLGSLIVPYIRVTLAETAADCHKFLCSDMNSVCQTSSVVPSTLFPSIPPGLPLLRAGPLNISAQFEGTKANKSHCPFRNSGLFAAFHDLFFRHLSPSPHSGSPRKSMVPYIPVWQVRRIHANPHNLAFLPHAVTGKGGPQRVILSEKQ